MTKRHKIIFWSAYIVLATMIIVVGIYVINSAISEKRQFQEIQNLKPTTGTVQCLLGDYVLMTRFQDLKTLPGGYVEFYDAKEETYIMTNQTCLFIYDLKLEKE